MPIVTPQINTKIEQRSYNNPDRDAALKALLMGVDTGNKETLQHDEAGIKDNAQGKELDRIKGMNLKPGDSGKVGDTAVSKTGEGALQNKALTMQIGAQRHLNDTYNKSLTKMSDQAQAITDGLESLQHPNNLTAGQLRTNMIRASGMTRYSNDEGGQLLPSTVQEKMSHFLGSLGADNASISATQAKQAQQFYQDHLDSLARRHDFVKRNALSQYPSQLGPAPSIGGEFESHLNDIRGKYLSPQAMQSTASAQSTNPVTQPAAPGGFMDKLAGFLKGGSSQQPQAPAAPAMSFEEFKKARAEGRL